MKTFPLFIMAAVVFSAPLSAQDVVTTGTIKSYSKDDSRLLLVPSDRATTALVFPRINSVPLFYADGGRAPLWELQPGRLATIHYRMVGQRWVMSRVSLATPAPPALPAGLPVGSVHLPTGERHALFGKALNDRDVTTQPGSKAAIDRDITTKPSGIANRDRDITTHADRR